jgi:hypothetical protein
MAQQMARRAYLFGGGAVNKTWKDDLGKMNERGQTAAVVSTAMDTTSDVAGVLMSQPDDGRGHHDHGRDKAQPVRKTDTWRDGTTFGMTPQEYTMRQAGESAPKTGWGSDNPSGYGFNFGKEGVGTTAEETATDSEEVLVKTDEKGDRKKGRNIPE